MENIKQAKIVANLPYYITTPIIMKLLEEKLLEEKTNLKIELIDERLSTVEAERILLDYDMSRKKRKEHIDNTAAAIILDTYLRREEKK